VLPIGCGDFWLAVKDTRETVADADAHDKNHIATNPKAGVLMNAPL
jgi:hypothetical protein